MGSVMPEALPYQRSFIRGAKAANAELTGRAVQKVIAQLKAKFAEHPFIRRMASFESMHELQRTAETIAFFVLCFQDVLRLVRVHVADPELRDVAGQHEREDRGHDNWFLHDLEQLGAHADLRSTFSVDHEKTRDTSYQLISEVLAAKSDFARIAIALSLEAIGAEFFPRVNQSIERLSPETPLRYFSRHHERVEAAHEVFEQQAQDRLMARVLSEAEYDDAVHAVRRTFECMSDFAGELHRRLATPPVETKRVGS